MKLIRTINENGEETQEEIQPEDINPGTKVTVVMQVPETVGDKEFRIMHVHSPTDIETVDYVREGDVVYVTVDRLSDFAFVVDDTRVKFAGYKFDMWVFVLLWLLLLLLIVVIILLYRSTRRSEKRKYGRKY